MKRGDKLWKIKWFKPQIELQWPSQLPVRSWYSLPSSHVITEAGGIRPTDGSLAEPQDLHFRYIFIIATKALHLRGGLAMTTWLACTNRITCQRVADGCGIGLRMLAVFKGTAAPFGFDVVGYLFIAARPGLASSNFTYFLIYIALFSTTSLLRLLRSVSMVSVLLVSLWRRWWFSQPACWMVARISTGTVARTGSLEWIQELVIASHCESLWVPQFLVSYVSLHHFASQFWFRTSSRCIPVSHTLPSFIQSGKCTSGTKGTPQLFQCFSCLSMSQMKNAHSQAEKIFESMLRGMPPAIQTSWSITASKETPLEFHLETAAASGIRVRHGGLEEWRIMFFLLQTDFLIFWFVLHFTDLVYRYVWILIVMFASYGFMMGPQREKCKVKSKPMGLQSESRESTCHHVS